MSEAWTQLLRDVDNGLTRAIDLERVTISRSTGNMHAYFTSSRLLSSRERGIMERAMRAGFPKVGACDERPLSVSSRKGAGRHKRLQGRGNRAGDGGKPRVHALSHVVGRHMAA